MLHLPTNIYQLNELNNICQFIDKLPYGIYGFVFKIFNLERPFQTLGVMFQSFFSSMIRMVIFMAKSSNQSDINLIIIEQQYKIMISNKISKAVLLIAALSQMSVSNYVDSTANLIQNDPVLYPIDPVIPVKKCPPNQVWSPVGCIKSCSAPEFKKCPDVFIQIFDPKFCGWTKDGKWRDITFACEGCKSGDVLGISDGKCTCSQIPCEKGFKCQNNECVPIQDPCSKCLDYEYCSYGKCVDQCQILKCKPRQVCSQGKCVNPCIFAKCANGFTCDYGNCVPNTCSAGVKQIKCDVNNRPNLKTCPEIFFFRAPDPVVCGVDEFGNRQDYAVECYACRDKINVSYFNKPCAQVGQIVCSQNQDCLDGKCVTIDKCYGKCKTWENCFQGKCIDRCQLLRCANCFQGQCGVIDKCSVLDCRYKCVDGQCVDPIDNCAAITCPTGSQCLNGGCVFIDPPFDNCAAVTCLRGQTCVNGKCLRPIDPIDNCARILCPANSQCKNGKCVIIDKCALIRCAAGFKCINGNCVKNIKPLPIEYNLDQVPTY